MKNLFSLVCLVVLLGVSVNVMGQSTGTAPFPGATHSYTVVANSGSTFVWTVYKTNLTTTAPVADFTLTPNTAGNVATILWDPTVSTTTDYFVRVIETTTASGCTNTKVVKVTPVPSNFNVAVTSPIPPCWTAVTVTLDGTNNPVYNHGTATIVYTFTPTDNQGAYKFDYAIPTLADFTWATPTITGGTLTGTNGAGTVTSTNGVDPVTLTFVVTRTDLSNTTDAVGDKADFNSNLTLSGAKTGPGFSISESIDAADVADNIKNIFVVRPHTQTIATSLN